MSALKKATGATVTGTQNQLSESYQKDYRLSNLKLQIGEFLLLIQAPLKPYERKVCLQNFESVLNKYIELKYAGRQL